MNIFETVISYFNYPFVRYALIAGVLIALCAALLGVSLVLKRYSMIGDGLSHVAFGAMAVATVCGMAPMTVTLPVTIVAAVILLGLTDSSKIKGDAAIAMISVGALALGYLLLNIFSASANVSGDVCTTLFGSTSILTLSKQDVYTCIILAAVVIVAYTLFYNRIFSVTFDENFATATGTHSSVYNLALAVITAVVIVIAMNLVGALLISALIIFPALSAMRIFRSFRGATICSAVIAVVCSLSGILFSIMFNTPVGATIVAADIIVFVFATLAGKIKKA